jgi:hypothetical protein
VSKEEAFELVKPMDREQQLQWMAKIGIEISGTAGRYLPGGAQPGRTDRLISLNRLQHLVFWRIRLLLDGRAGPVEQFLDALYVSAAQHQFEKGFDLILEDSLKQGSAY